MPVRPVRAIRAVHLVYLSRGGEDVLLNIVPICPNHHTVIHRTDATFDHSRLAFCFPNGRIEPLCLNTHLQARTDVVHSARVAGRMAPPETAIDLPVLCQAIVQQLTPDLLTEEWAAARRPGSHPLTGYCDVASEALYHLAGGPNSGLSVYRCSLPEGGTHWWLADPDGRIIDPTAEQFTESPYALGVRTHFLTRQPSHRSAGLIARVTAALRSG